MINHFEFFAMKKLVNSTQMLFNVMGIKHIIIYTYHFKIDNFNSEISTFIKTQTVTKKK